MPQNWLAITGNHLSAPPTLPKAPGPGAFGSPAYNGKGVSYGFDEPSSTL